MGKLTVHLDRIENLKDVDHIGKSDPYVELHLEKDNRFLDKNYGKHTSKCIKDTTSPVFNETFVFNDVPADLKNMKLHLQVKDSDIGKDDFMGETTLILSNYDLGPTPKAIEHTVATHGIIIKKQAIMYLSLSFA